MTIAINDDAKSAWVAAGLEPLAVLLRHDSDVVRLNAMRAIAVLSANPEVWKHAHAWAQAHAHSARSTRAAGACIGN
jgi:hypothetical protein